VVVTVLQPSGHATVPKQLCCPEHVTSHPHDVLQSMASPALSDVQESEPEHVIVHSPGPHTRSAQDDLPVQSIVHDFAWSQCTPAVHALPMLHRMLQLNPGGQSTWDAHTVGSSMQLMSQVIDPRSQLVHGCGQLPGASGVGVPPSPGVLPSPSAASAGLLSTQNPLIHVRPVAHWLGSVQAKSWLRCWTEQLVAMANAINATTKVVTASLTVGRRIARPWNDVL
jgi:hypothetical protein